jgi:hypothetical protein
LLRHNGQREIIAVAALVAHLISVAVTGEDRAVRKIGEGGGNRISRGVLNNSEDCAYRESTVRDVSKSKFRAIVNRGAIGDYAIGFCCFTVQIEVVNRVGLKSQCVLDG